MEVQHICISLRGDRDLPVEIQHLYCLKRRQESSDGSSTITSIFNQLFSAYDHVKIETRLREGASLKNRTHVWKKVSLLYS